MPSSFASPPRAAAPLLLAATASAFQIYVALNPNGANVPGVAAIGHVSPAGGGVNNKYGLAFAGNNYEWNITLACADSDNDGYPNGWELGDPCGNWTAAAKILPTWNTDISHPGLRSSVPQTRKLPLDWSVCGTTNPCAGLETAASPRQALRG